MNKNDFSKFKYENSYNLKFSVNTDTQQTSLLNVELRTIKPNLSSITNTHLNINQTIVTDYIYSCNQVNNVDQSMAALDKSPIKRVFFKLLNFKLS